MVAQKAMEPANLDDLLFRNKNKGYGAYELRRNYDKRLTVAFLVTVSFFIALLIGLGKLPNPIKHFVIAYPKNDTDSGINIIRIHKDLVLVHPKKQVQKGRFAGRYRITNTAEPLDTMPGIIGSTTGIAGLLSDNNGFGDDLAGFPDGNRKIKIPEKHFITIPDEAAEFPGGRSGL